MTENNTQKGRLLEVAGVFLKMGFIAFGGPAAHVAMMEEEVVEKRKWMSRQHFLDLMGATNLIPGPNSTEMTMHCGHERAGVPGLFVAGISFILPAVLLTGLLAWFYTAYGDLPAIEPLFSGIKPAVLVLIISAIYKLGKKALKNPELGVLGGLTLVAGLLGVNEILALLSAGLIGALYFYFTRHNKGTLTSLIPLAALPASSGLMIPLSTKGIFFTFLKVGAVLYGSGYVLFAYLEAELVTPGFMTNPDLMDAIAMGQFTPGPVLSTATFVGFQLGGWQGAVAATLGIFLPCFLFVWLLNPLVPKLRASRFLAGFLDSVNIAAVAVMVSVLFSMGVSTLLNWQMGVVAVLSGILFFTVKQVNAMWLVAFGAVSGWLLSFI